MRRVVVGRHWDDAGTFVVLVGALKLVTCVGDETPLARDAGLGARQQVVQRDREARELIVTVRDRHSVIFGSSTTSTVEPMGRISAPDYTLYKAANGLTGHPATDALLRFTASDLHLLLIAAVALIFLIRWPSHRSDRRAGAVLATVAAGAALLLNQPLSHAVDRVRPYAAHPHAHLLLPASSDPSFPSDHATGAFALAVGVWMYDRLLGSVLLVPAAILGVARVAAGTHYPSDVVAGALIGGGVALGLFSVQPVRRRLELLAQQAGRGWDGAAHAAATRLRRS